MQIFIMGLPGESKVLGEGISKYHDLNITSKNTSILLLFKGSESQSLSKGSLSTKTRQKVIQFLE